MTVGDADVDASTRGDLFVVPSWQPLSVRSEAGTSDSDSGALDLFRFSDTPIFEALHLDRVAAWTGTPDEARHHPHATAGPAPSGSTDDAARRPRRRRRRRAPGRRRTGEERAAAADGTGRRRCAARPSPRSCPRPGKIVCVGLNYRTPHPGDGPRPARVPDAVREVRRHPRSAPTTTSCCRRRPTRSTGRPSSPSSSARRSAGRAASEAEAAIAGFTVLNDVTCATGSSAPGSGCRARPGRPRPRSGPSWSRPTSCPAGSGPRWTITHQVDGEIVQKADTADLLFDPVDAGRVRLDDRHAAARRRDRHRHARRRRPRPQAAALPRRRRPCGHRDRAASAGWRTSRARHPQTPREQPRVRLGDAQPRAWGRGCDDERKRPMDTTDADVIVVGGGIGGLATALALARKGLRVTVLERSSEFGEVGAGMQIAPNCTRILRRLRAARRGAVARRAPEEHGDARRRRRLRADPPRPDRRRAALRLPLRRHPPQRPARHRCCGPAGGPASSWSPDVEGDRLRAAPRRRAPSCTPTGRERGPRRHRRRRSALDRPQAARRRPAGQLGVRRLPRRGARSTQVRANGRLAGRTSSSTSDRSCHFVQYPLRGGEMLNQVAVFESPKACAGEEDWGTPDELDARLRRHLRPGHGRACR